MKTKFIWVVIAIIVVGLIVIGFTRNTEEAPKTEPLAVEIVEEKFEFIQPALGKTEDNTAENREWLMMIHEDVSGKQDQLRKEILAQGEDLLSDIWQAEEALERMAEYFDFKTAQAHLIQKKALYDAHWSDKSK